MSRSDRFRIGDGGLESPCFPRSRANLEAEHPLRAGYARARDHRNHPAAGPASERNFEREPLPPWPEGESKTLTDIGTFRTLGLADVARHRYGNDLDNTRKHLAALASQGLVRLRTSYPRGAVFVTLTPAGHRLVAGRGERENPDQRLYHGFVKTSDARHDAALYPLYQQEAARIKEEGGRVKRVVLDLEFRQSINRRLAKLKALPEEEQILQKYQIAQDHGLTVVKGKIALPDLRLEYEGPDQQLAKVDLELVTSHYNHHTLAVKAQAGFAIYAFAEDAARLGAGMQDPEIMQDILSL